MKVKILSYEIKTTNNAHCTYTSSFLSVEFFVLFICLFFSVFSIVLALQLKRHKGELSSSTSMDLTTVDFRVIKAIKPTQERQSNRLVWRFFSFFILISISSTSILWALRLSFSLSFSFYLYLIYSSSCLPERLTIV
jgi:hypothetical protein